MPFSDTVKRVIDLADAIQDYWDVELRKWHPKYPIIGEEGEYAGPPPSEEAELRDLLRSLPAEDVYKLMALRDLGRGLYPASEFQGRWRNIATGGVAVEDAISELIGTDFLSADLDDGLSALSAAGIDVDLVQPSPV